ncbi:DUF805 domain-containing protein [Hyphomonas oceanitis]|uniref:DUF805 domain-containing protein n=1 Tax=Hyphomonas oceanitis TaxID=81033 RepID=UPI003002FA2F
MSFAKVLFNPNGRISQRQFWAGWGVLVFGNLIAVLPALTLGPIFIAISILIYIALIYVGCCVYGKRLHDMGKTAWWLAIPWILVLLTTFAAFVTDLSEAEFILSTGYYMVWFAYTMWVGVSGSDPNTNKYGPGRDASNGISM